MSREKPIITFSLIYTWTVAEGGGDDVWRTLGRLRRERRKSLDVTALPTTAVFVTVPVCSKLHSAVIIFYLNDARNIQKTSNHFYNKKSLKTNHWSQYWNEFIRMKNGFSYLRWTNDEALMLEVLLGGIGLEWPSSETEVSSPAP